VSFPIHSFYGNSEPKLSKSSNFFRKRPREGHRGVDLIFTILPYGRLVWQPYVITNAVGYAKFYSRSHDAVIGVFDLVGNMVDAHEQAGDFKEW